MFKIIEDLPADVLGVEPEGMVTHEDYKSVLIPAAEKMLVRGPIKMLYVTGPDFKGYELGAMWDDTSFGLKHWREFSQIAVVTDVLWLKGAASMFAPFFPGEVRMFPESGREEAEVWITGVGKKGRAAS